VSFTRDLVGVAVPEAVHLIADYPSGLSNLDKFKFLGTMSCAMSQYYYSPLSQTPDSIRLLRLMPNKNDTADIQCELFEYALQESDKATHLYEALSYVWGDSDKRRPIFMDNQYLAVTLNLYAALLRLRDRDIPRIIWVDAVCINQGDKQEKEHQIWSMAKIYGKASRVIV